MCCVRVWVLPYEMTMPSPPLLPPIQVSGNLYCQFTDPAKAAYGSKNPIYAVKQHAQSSMRAGASVCVCVHVCARRRRRGHAWQVF